MFVNIAVSKSHTYMHVFVNTAGMCDIVMSHGFSSV